MKTKSDAEIEADKAIEQALVEKARAVRVENDALAALMILHPPSQVRDGRGQKAGPDWEAWKRCVAEALDRANNSAVPVREVPSSLGWKIGDWPFSPEVEALLIERSNAIDAATMPRTDPLGVAEVVAKKADCEVKVSPTETDEAEQAPEQGTLAGMMKKAGLDCKPSAFGSGGLANTLRALGNRRPAKKGETLQVGSIAASATFGPTGTIQGAALHVEHVETVGTNGYDVHLHPSLDLHALAFQVMPSQGWPTVHVESDRVCISLFYEDGKACPRPKRVTLLAVALSPQAIPPVRRRSVVSFGGPVPAGSAQTFDSAHVMASMRVLRIGYALDPHGMLRVQEIDAGRDRIVLCQGDVSLAAIAGPCKPFVLEPGQGIRVRVKNVDHADHTLHLDFIGEYIGEEC